MRSNFSLDEIALLLSPAEAGRVALLDGGQATPGIIMGITGKRVLGSLDERHAAPMWVASMKGIA